MMTEELITQAFTSYMEGRVLCRYPSLSDFAAIKIITVRLEFPEISRAE